jgi:hypothetical protein
MRWLRRLLGTSSSPRYGDTEVKEARRIGDAEREAGTAPPGCAWLDAQTQSDLDLPLVFESVDRTATPLGAQMLWRWLAAPATSPSVLAERERKLELVADPALRTRITQALPEQAGVDAEFLPRLLWEPQRVPPASPVAAIVIGALALCLALSGVNPGFVVGAALLIGTAMLIDMVAQRDLAEQAHAFVVLSSALDGAARLAHDRAMPPLLVGTIRDDLVVHAQMRKRLMLLSVQDPFGLFEILRSALLVRLFTMRSLVRIVERERDRLRRIVCWVGELDALASISRLREERADTSIPDLAGTEIDAQELVHPALANAVPNDLTLAAGMLITGSNASGKSTFLRTVGINAVLAASLHTTFCRWRGPLVRVRAAMRINDDLGSGMSTYAAEVASVGDLVNHVTGAPGLPLLALLDEPFHGTNPAVRVPIVVAVLEYLVEHGLVLAATHDLDVARLVSDRFTRGYFTDLGTDVGGSDFDRTLRHGIAPSTNAFALLARAGYPTAILEKIGQVASPVSTPASTVPRNG